MKYESSTVKTHTLQNKIDFSHFTRSLKQTITVTFSGSN